MLAPFVIDADSLAPDPGWTPAQLRNCHQSLLDIWKRIGLLIHDADAFETCRLNQAVQQLPQKIRPLWHEMLKHAPLRACGNKWDGSVSRSNVAMLCNMVSVAIVDDTRAEVEFDFLEDDLSRPAPDAPTLEVCRLLAAAQAKNFQQALDQSAAHIEQGDKFNDIWSLRFHALASAPIKRVIVVDRYAMSQHFNCPQTQLSGLERFLRLLDQSAQGPRYVSLFTAWTAELGRKTLDDVEVELRRVMSKFYPKQIKRLKVVMAPNVIFSHMAHDRFFRFESYVWDIGLGLKVFEGAFAAERSSAIFKTGGPVDGYKKIEHDLDTCSQAKFLELLL